MTTKGFTYPLLVRDISESLVDQVRLISTKHHVLVVLPEDSYGIVKNNSILFGCLLDLLDVDKTNCVLCPEAVLK